MYVHFHGSDFCYSEKGSLVKVSHFLPDFNEALIHAHQTLSEGGADLAFLHNWLTIKAILKRNVDDSIALLTIERHYFKFVPRECLFSVEPSLDCQQKTILDIHSPEEAHEWAEDVLKRSDTAVAALTSNRGLVAAWQYTPTKGLFLIAGGEYISPTKRSRLQSHKNPT
jgi:hypothetical protein